MPVFNQDPKINANANIITANSKEELPDPSTVKPNTVALVPSVGQSVYVYDTLDAAAAANLPEGSLVAVPSEGGGGLPVVELTTILTNEEVDLSTEDAAKMDALNGALCHIKCSYGGEMVITVCPHVVDIGEGMYIYTAQIPIVGIVYNFTVGYVDGRWIGVISQNV